MGLISHSLGLSQTVRALSLEDPAQPLLPAGALFESLGLGRSDAGVLVNEQQAMRVTTAHACVKVISEDLSSTSHVILQELPDDSLRSARDHRLWGLIHDEPNPRMSAVTFWGVLVACLVGWGNGYAWIKRDGAARAVALVPLKPGLTSPVKVNGQMMYGTTQTDTGAVAYIDPANILHVMNVTFDGVLGMGPVMCMNAFGLAMAAEKFGAQFFGNGARATGVFTYPGALEEEAFENLQKSLREKATGENALRPMILEEGLDWKQMTIAPNEAQFLQTRRYQRTEIAGLYRVPLHLIGDLERSTNNNIEHQSLDYIRYCLRPNAVKIEQEVTRKLLGAPFSMEHDFYDMTRGDFASQTAGFQSLRNIGVFSANDIRRKIREKPISAEDGGDVYTVQGAMIPLSALVNYEPENNSNGEMSQSAESNLPSRASYPRASQLTGAYRALFRDAVGRILHRGGGADPEFARRVVQPAISSMAQAMLALRFGNCELTRNEQNVIAQQAGQIAMDAALWQKSDAAAIASRLAESTYETLAKEILV